MNSSGLGLIAGTNGPDPYAAFVNASGLVAPPLSGFMNGQFTTGAISASGLALVGGADNVSAYVAQLLPDGTITPISAPLNIVESVAINDSGVGLIGGEGTGINPYAAYVFPDGSLTPITTTLSDAGHIYTVSINQSGNGVIGGWDDNMVTLNFAFTVTSDGNAVPIDLDTPDFCEINSSAINSSGTILLGGQDFDANCAVAYLVNGTVTPLLNCSSSGVINCAALNDSGLGLIAGNLAGTAYAAIVQPDGNLIAVFDSPMSGSINGIALNEAGIGLIGGSIDSSAYLALVAPNGALTPLNASDPSVINSVAFGPFAFNAIADQAVPTACGPFGSAIYSQLTANSALNTHFIQKNKIWSQPYNNSETTTTRNPASIFGDEKLLASNEALLPSFSQSFLSLSPTAEATVKNSKAPVSKRNSIWIQPFGDYIHVKKQGSNPTFSNEIGGALIGYERENTNYIVGATLGYAFNYIDYSQSLGHCKLQEEMASLYGAFYANHFWLASALWGGIYQFHNKRHTFSHITSKGHSHGWILAPYLEMASPWQIGSSGKCYIEPFFSLNWVNNWQHSFTESGHSGLNLKMPRIHDSLLQSELGLRFYERLVYGWGDFCLEEKFSYINLAPFGFKSTNTAFVGSPSNFPIAIGTSKTQNLGAFQILGAFVPRNSCCYGGFSFQASAGSSFQSYFGSLFWGVNF